MSAPLKSKIMSKKEKIENEKIVLTGTYEGSYNRFNHVRANRYDNKKIKLNIIKLFQKKVK